MSKIYVIDNLDGNVYYQDHTLADPIEMLERIQRLQDEISKLKGTKPMSIVKDYIDEKV